MSVISEAAIVMDDSLSRVHEGETRPNVYHTFDKDDISCTFRVLGHVVFMSAYGCIPCDRTPAQRGANKTSRISAVPGAAAPEAWGDLGDEERPRSTRDCRQGHYLPGKRPCSQGL